MKINIKNVISNIVKMLKILWKNDRKFLFLVFLDTLLVVLFPFFTMYLAKYSISLLSDLANYRDYLYVILFILTSIFILSIFQSLTSSKTGVLGNLIGDRLFLNIFRKTLELDYELLHNKKLQDKRELAMKVIEGGRFNNLIGCFKQFVSSLIILFGVIFVVSKIDLYILVIVFIIVIINSISTKNQKKNERIVNLESAEVNRKISYFWNINSDFSYGKEIRTYGLLDSLVQRFTKLTEEIEKFVKRVFGFQRHSRIIYLITKYCLDCLIYLYLGYKVLVLQDISVGDFVLFLSAITTFYSSVQLMASSYVDLESNGLYLNDYFEYLETKSRMDIGKKLISNIGSFSFKFDHVSFSYPNQSTPCIKDVSFEINTNDRISLVGENGAGKTTIIKLLMRLYDPTEGTIYLNGINIKEYKYDEYLRLFSTVFQDYKIFAFKIHENISFQSSSEIADEEHIMDVLSQLGLTQMIKRLENGLNTYIGQLYDENGIQLSGGESQKLAIARALYKDSPVIILDEPTASLDPISENEIYYDMNKLVHGKISVFITHRLASTKSASKILVLKQGELIEVGTHEQLINKKGYYSVLFNIQANMYLSSTEE